MDRWKESKLERARGCPISTVLGQITLDKHGRGHFGLDKIALSSVFVWPHLVLHFRRSIRRWKMEEAALGKSLQWTVLHTLCPASRIFLCWARWRDCVHTQTQISHCQWHWLLLRWGEILNLHMLNMNTHIWDQPFHVVYIRKGCFYTIFQVCLVFLVAPWVSG